MAGQNIYEELKEVLEDFKTTLAGSVDDIGPAIQQLAELIPQINELIDKLIDLMGKLRTEIEELDVRDIPGIAAVATFTDKVKAFLAATKNLLPDEADTIDEVLGVADVVSGLPSLEEIKGEILKLIDEIVELLNQLKAQ